MPEESDILDSFKFNCIISDASFLVIFSDELLPNCLSIAAFKFKSGKSIISSDAITNLELNKIRTNITNINFNIFFSF